MPSAARAIAQTAATVTKPFLSVLEAVSQSTAKPSAGSRTGDLATSELRAQADQLRVELQERIQQVAASLDVKLNGPLRVEISATDGRIELRDRHPQRVVLEAALNSDASLVDQVKRLATLEQLLTDSSEP